MNVFIVTEDKELFSTATHGRMQGSGLGRNSFRKNVRRLLKMKIRA